MVGGGKARSECDDEVEGGRGTEGNFASVVVVVEAVALGRDVAFDRKSECVRLDLGW